MALFFHLLSMYLYIRVTEKSNVCVAVVEKGEPLSWKLLACPWLEASTTADASDHAGID